MRTLLQKRMDAAYTNGCRLGQAGKSLGPVPKLGRYEEMAYVAGHTVGVLWGPSASIDTTFSTR